MSMKGKIAKSLFDAAKDFTASGRNIRQADKDAALVKDIKATIAKDKEILDTNAKQKLRKAQIESYTKVKDRSDAQYLGMDVAEMKKTPQELIDMIRSSKNDKYIETKKASLAKMEIPAKFKRAESEDPIKMHISGKQIKAGDVQYKGVPFEGRQKVIPASETHGLAPLYKGEGLQPKGPGKIKGLSEEELAYQRKQRERPMNTPSLFNMGKNKGQGAEGVKSISAESAQNIAEINAKKIKEALLAKQRAGKKVLGGE